MTCWHLPGTNDLTWDHMLILYLRRTSWLYLPGYQQIYWPYRLYQQYRVYFCHWKWLGDNAAVLNINITYQIWVDYQSCITYRWLYGVMLVNFTLILQGCMTEKCSYCHPASESTLDIMGNTTWQIDPEPPPTRPLWVNTNNVVIHVQRMWMSLCWNFHELLHLIHCHRSVKNWDKYIQVRCTSFFPASWPYVMFTSLLFEIKLRWSNVLLSGFLCPKSICLCIKSLGHTELNYNTSSLPSGNKPLPEPVLSQSILLYGVTMPRCLNTLRPTQNGRHFADDSFKCIFLNKNVWIPIEISLKFVPKVPINNIPALV